MSEEKLVQEVHRALEQGMETIGLDINITARGGEVTLVGIVDWLAEKEKAEVLAKQVPGVTNVENALTLAMDGQMTDRDIESEAMAKLEQAKLTEFGVEVNEGIVSLVGHGDDDALEKARALIAHVQGVKEIINNS
ncbi:MAG: BON domain-containing protein [Bacillota bacterium]|nr:BON domain-containing protein [Bacillota bacterium]